MFSSLLKWLLTPGVTGHDSKCCGLEPVRANNLQRFQRGVVSLLSYSRSSSRASSWAKVPQTTKPGSTPGAITYWWVFLSCRDRIWQILDQTGLRIYLHIALILELISPNSSCSRSIHPLHTFLYFLQAYNMSHVHSAAPRYSPHF